MRFIRRASFCLCFALCFWLIACGDACPKGDTERQISRAEPVFIRDSPYAKGKMYHMANTYNPEQVVKVLTVSGSDYEMGQAIGDLLKNEIHAAIDSVLPYYKEKYGKLLRNYLPGFIVDILMWMLDYVGYFALELTWFMTRTFTNRRVFDELHGVANATGLDYMRLVKLSMFPELIKAKCSLVGAWGDATPDRNVYYLRALDWDSHNPVTGVPVIIFYRPSEKGAIPYANIGYAGLFGVLTAVSKAGLAIGEKAWYPNDYDNAETRFVGTPWHYVLRDIAEFAQDLESATKMLIDAKKTATIHLG